MTLYGVRLVGSNVVSSMLSQKSVGNQSVTCHRGILGDVSLTGEDNGHYLSEMHHCIAAGVVAQNLLLDLLVGKEKVSEGVGAKGGIVALCFPEADNRPFDFDSVKVRRECLFT